MINKQLKGSQSSRLDTLDVANTKPGHDTSALKVHICNQSFGGQGKSLRFGACSGELECSHLMPHDRLILYQFGMNEDNEVTTNYIEITKDREQLTFSFFVEALGGCQGVIRRSIGKRRMKLIIKTDLRFGDSYSRIRFMLYDPNYRVSNEQLIVQWYDISETQRIQGVGVALALAKEQNGIRKLRGEPVGFDHFMAYTDSDIPSILKPGFEWTAGKVGTIPGVSIISNHSESYRSPTTVDLRLWKEYVYSCL
jgi:hypothetical protein